MGGVVVDQSVVERVEDGDKEKKKTRRRSNRRSKHNSSSISASNSLNEVRGESSELSGNGVASGHTTSLNCSSTPQELSMHPSDEHAVAKASAIAFTSMPTMHINKKGGMEDVHSPENCNLVPSEQMLSKSCPEPIASEGCFGALVRKKLISSQKIEGSPQRKYYTPHWPVEAVNEALEKGDAFKALLRVNAHNRLEAYCKIEGVPTDILINGIASQNRAVEGDTVVIKVDPLPQWTRMKGSAGYINNFPQADVLLPEVNGSVGNSCKGKSKVEDGHEKTQCNGCLLPENEFPTEKKYLPGEAGHLEHTESGQHSYDNGHFPCASDSTYIGSSSAPSDGENALGRICALVSSFPSRRPTGRVLAIVEGSSRRNVVIGFLSVKCLLSYKEGFRKDSSKNKISFSFSEYDYAQLLPTDPKFPQMMVCVDGLPVCIKKRLEDGDLTVEKELVAAKIDRWDEESPIPQACIVRVFGQGGELEPHINAILFENEINCSDFSVDSLSCLPSVPWEVPVEELKSRRDLRNLCTFTIDPSSASDLDDALSIEKLPNDISRVGVHIADVSHFVLPDTALDIEAQIRSTSVYMPQRKIPMLPPLLSEHLGSLNPGVDRLAFSIFWDINSDGEVIDRWIGRTVIRSCCKFSYEHAQDIIDENLDMETYNSRGNCCPQLHGHFEWSDVIGSVKSLHKVSQTLREKRFNNGALQLENSKVVYLLDEYGVPYDSKLCGRKDSNFLVEEFMLLANRTAAEVISRAFPDSALLRKHPEPDMRKLREFEAFCCKHSLELDSSSSRLFHLSLEQIREKLKNDSVLFNILISYATRPMQLASYFCTGDVKDGENDWSHYALAVPLYTHFTSPLRRYPDIVVHRTLAAAIEAEELYLSHHQSTFDKVKKGEEVARCFTGLSFDKDVASSVEGRQALSAAALKHRIPRTELLAGVAVYCNDRELACRHVKDSCDKLYMWLLLKKKEVLFSEARVMGLGPRFMSIYIQELAIERRINYDEVEGLTAEWLEATSTLVLSLCENRRSYRRGSPCKFKALEDAAWIISPCNQKYRNGSNVVGVCKEARDLERDVGEVEPAVFPLTVHILSTIPVALHAVGGENGPLEIGVKLYMTSYIR